MPVRLRSCLGALVLVTLATAACVGSGSSDPVPTPCVDCEVDFELVVAPDATGVSGQGSQIDVTVTRRGYDGAIALSAEALPANVSAGPANVAAGATTGRLTLDVLAAAVHGRYPIKVIATDTDGGRRREVDVSLLVRGAPGSLDTSFAGTGVYTRPAVGVAFGAQAIAVQDGGAILVTGNVGDRTFIARVKEDGSADDGYGEAGLGSARREPHVDNAATLPTSLAIDAAGRAIVGGYATIPSELAVARFDATGKLDASFATGGLYTTNIPIPDRQADNAEIVVTGVAVQSTGNVIAAGSASANLDVGNPHPFVIRLTPAGALDGTFGENGIALTMAARPNNDPARCAAVAVAADDAIFCAGKLKDDPVGELYVEKRTANGALDATFGRGGIAEAVFQVPPLPVSAQTVHALPDGKIIVTGRRAPTVIVAARLTATGAVDTTFGAAGVTDIARAGDDGGPLASAVDESGALYLVTAVGAERDVYITRLLPSGIADGSFGTNGFVILPLPQRGTHGNIRIALAPGGRLAVTTTLNTGTTLLVARMWR